MARNHFSYEKRQKELAKKKKKEEKRVRRQERKELGIKDDMIATVNEYGEIIPAEEDETAGPDDPADDADPEPPVPTS